MSNHSPRVDLVAWDGPIDAHDPDANFKADVALYSGLDPMTTVEALAGALGMPEGAIVRYVVAKWASAGSAGLLEIGPQMVQQLWAVTEAAEALDTEEARLAAYGQLRQMVSWLRHPLTVDGPESGY